MPARFPPSLLGSYCLATPRNRSVHASMDTEYESQIARARTMLATLGALLAHHERDAKQRSDERDYVAELDACCTKLGEAAITITTTT